MLVVSGCGVKKETKPMPYKFIENTTTVNYADLVVMNKNEEVDFKSIPHGINSDDNFPNKGFWERFWRTSTTLEIYVSKGWKNKIKLIYE